MILNFLKGSLLQESKQDIDNFINKFGQDTYDLFKKSIQRLKNNKISTDLTYHTKNTSKEELDNILFALQSKVKTTSQNDLSKGIPGKYNFIGEFDGYKVYQPLDYISSMALGVNTGWCTTGRYGHYGEPNFKPSEEDAKMHFDDYTKNGVKLYYFLDSKTMYGEYALALYGRTIEVKKCTDNYYIKSTNFEIYNAKDDLDYSAMDKLPVDKLNIGLKYDVLKGENGLFIKDGVLLKVKEDLVNVTIPEEVTRIGKSAFRECTRLTSITIPGSVKSIGAEAFRECDRLTTITIQNGVTKIGNGAFKDCTNLTSITIPDSVKSIGAEAFINCMKLPSITIPDGVKSIGEGLFTNCIKLTSITIPDGVKSIGGYAFYNCTSLTSITIPDNVTNIGQGAFEDCKRLTSITIPNSVTSVGILVFDGCKNLTIYTDNEYVIDKFKDKFPIKPLTEFREGLEVSVLKENLLKEDINLEEPDIQTTKFSIYKINQRSDFDAFTLPNNENVAEHFGLNETNWNSYVQSGSCIVLVITAPIVRPQSEVVGAMLLWSDSMNNFLIRGDNRSSVKLPITFESVNSTSNTAYFNFITEFEATLPLKEILLKYNDFCNQQWRDHLNLEASDGSYVDSDRLQGVYEEFYSLNEDGRYIYTDLVFNEAYSRLKDHSIDWKNRAWSNIENAPTWKITWTNNVRDWTPDCITQDSLSHILFDFQGDEELKTQIQDSFSEGLANRILYDNENEEARSDRLAREEEARRQAQHEEDLYNAREWDREVTQHLDENSTQQYNEDLLQWAAVQLDIYNTGLTDTQRALVTKYQELTDVIEAQKRLKREYFENQYQQEAREILTKLEQLKTTLENDAYEYDFKDQQKLDELEQDYQKYSGARVKEIIADSVDFETTLNNLKNIYQTKKQDYLNQKAQKFTEQGLILFDNMLVCKQINSKEIAIVGSKNITSESLDIPSEVNGIKVTRIGPSAFAYNTSLRDKVIHIPNTVRYIGNLAFYKCKASIILIQPSNSNLVQLGRDCFNLSGSNSNRYVNKPNLSQFTKIGSSSDVVRITNDHWR